jgi:hypothetical protein
VCHVALRDQSPAPGHRAADLADTPGSTALNQDLSMNMQDINKEPPFGDIILTATRNARQNGKVTRIRPTSVIKGMPAHQPVIPLYL